MNIPPLCIIMASALLGAVASAGAQNVVQTETITWTDEGVAAPVGDVNQGSSTSVTTFDGDIYYAYIDRELQLVVGKQSGSENDTAVVTTGVKPDRNHVKPSIGVDNHGFIHVAMGRSQGYYMSDKSEDISGWSKQDIPVDLVDYPEFFKDRNGELYCVFRHRVIPDSFYFGSKAGGVMKYNTDDRSFTMLGGTDHGLAKTLSWSPNGGTDNHYQQPRPVLHFDDNNRMHFIASFIENRNKNGHDDQTHILYAYSDDGGATFHKAGGEVISSLPLTVQNASIVIDRSQEEDLTSSHYLGAFSSDRPVVGYRHRGGGGGSLVWDGASWTPITVPDDSVELISHPGGVTLWRHSFPTGNERFHLTNDGVNWTTLTAAPYERNRYFPSFDKNHFQATGDLRMQFIDWHGKDQRSRIHTFHTAPFVRSTNR